MTTRTAQVGTFSRRMLAVAAVAAIALSLSLTMRVALANDLKTEQAAQLPISWDDPAFQGDKETCDKAELDPGEVLWHFIHNGTDGSDLPSELTAEFDVAGVKTADGYSNGGGNSVVQYDIITGEDTLLSASDDIEDDGDLVLSHICFGGEVETASPTPTPTPTPTASPTATPTATPTGQQSVEAGTGTPAQSTANTALPFGGSSPLPTIVFSLILLASLGALAYANVKAARS